MTTPPAGAIASMTGQGRAAGDVQGRAWTVELRSVNARGLDVKVRAPAGFDLEVEARAAIGANAARGAVQATITLAEARQTSAIAIDHALLDRLIETYEEGRRSGRFLNVQPPRFDGLLQLRGVLTLPEATSSAPDPALRAALTEGLSRAAADWRMARLAEGAALRAALEAILDRIAQGVAAAALAAKDLPAAFADRLTARLADLAQKNGLDPQRLAQEAAILASKADITEEIDRLTAHVADIRLQLAQGGAIGRKLDFFAQELGRESNTISAKAGTLVLTRLAMDLKLAADQFKEQVQNIE